MGRLPGNLEGLGGQGKNPQRRPWLWEGAACHMWRTPSPPPKPQKTGSTVSGPLTPLLFLPPVKKIWGQLAKGGLLGHRVGVQIMDLEGERKRRTVFSVREGP